MKVRLLYVDTAESRDNDHGRAMDEGKAAAAFLAKELPIGSTVTLRGPKAELEQDRFQRALAVVWAHRHEYIGAAGSPAQLIPIEVNVNAAIISAGWSVYWRKFGGDPDKKNSNGYEEAQEEARAEKRGAWATAPQWMLDKANERTAPKN